MQSQRMQLESAYTEVGVHCCYLCLVYSARKKKVVVGLERGPLSLVSTTEELLDRKIAAPV
jgi:hypothetical protein